MCRIAGRLGCGGVSPRGAVGEIPALTDRASNACPQYRDADSGRRAV